MEAYNHESSSNQASLDFTCIGEMSPNKDKSDDQIREVISRMMGHKNEPSTLQHLHGVETAGVETASAGKNPTLH